ncbi:MAG: peptidoglycan DD-metalloendopeptidase family protein [Nitrospirae bacterium]|nr:peptidoglycan DD-metalloendopeptidase family protein [Nitrospirota bacterium]
MLGGLRKKAPHARKKKKEYFTVMILPGPNSKVRKFSIEKTFLRNLGIAVLVAVGLSTLMMGEYFHMRGQVWELDTLRAETSEQREQIKVFASNIVDMKGQMAQLQEMSDKIKSLARVGGREKSQQRLGIGGTSEMSSLNLDELGKKNQKELMEQMSQELDGLKAAAAEQEAGMKKLAGYLEHRNSVMAATPNIWPVRGFITSSFGYRRSPIYGTRQFHEGLDIANNIGTPVHAPANGTVAEVGYQTGYGRYIKIQHGYGTATIYGHLSKADVRPGERVKKGDVIGKVGNTGSSTGPHLHYEVRVNGVPRNPKNYL